MLFRLTTLFFHTKSSLTLKITSLLHPQTMEASHTFPLRFQISLSMISLRFLVHPRIKTQLFCQRDHHNTPTFILTRVSLARRLLNNAASLIVTREGMNVGTNVLFQTAPVLASHLARIAIVTSNRSILKPFPTNSGCTVRSSHANMRQRGLPEQTILEGI